MKKELTLLAGAGRAEIQLPEGMFPTEGFIGVHDPLHVRVLLMEQGEKAALVAVEMTSLADDECDALRELVSETAGVPVSHIWVYVTHTFSAPHIPPAFLNLDKEMAESRAIMSQSLRKAVRTATNQAITRMTSARLGAGQGMCDVNCNRDISTSKGTWLGISTDGLSDKTVTVLRLNNLAGEPIAVLFHYGVQSSIMDHCELSSGGQLVTADLTGCAANVVESAYGSDCVALFLTAPCGDQSPRKKGKYFSVDSDGDMTEVDYHEEGFSFIEQLGTQLGASVVSIAERTVCATASAPISFARRECVCPGKFHDREANKHGPRLEYIYEPADDEPLCIELLCIGEIALVGVKPELNCATGMQLKRRSTLPLTLPVQMVNGGQKYMPDQASYDRITYEAINSGFAPGCAERFVDWSLELMAESRKTL